MLPTLKNNAAAGYKGSVKIELLKGASLLSGIGIQRIDGYHVPFGPTLFSE